MKVAFLFGSGCEGTGQLGLPSGGDFKKEIVLSKETASLYSRINRYSDKMTNGAIIDARCSNILYQTFVEHRDAMEKLSPAVKKTIEDYIGYRNGKNKGSSQTIMNSFKKLYKSFIDESDTSDTSKEDKQLFFSNITLCSFSDELFNYIRRPDIYQTETQKLEKLYFSAYLSMLKSIYLTAESKDFVRDYLSSAPKDILSFRKKLVHDIVIWQETIIDKHNNKKSLYYSIIKDRNADYNLKDTVIITTNYTNFAESITGYKTAYLHGRLNWFEDVRTKQVEELSKFKVNQEIMPFIFIPSGIKPIVSLKQIEQYEIARKALTEYELLCILGYSINTDDEHIENFIRERLAREKKVVLFLYSAEKLPVNQQISFYKNEFDNNPYFEIKTIKNVEDFEKGLNLALSGR